MTQFPPHYPVEYIEGRVRFFGRDFAVMPDVLIPRLETEGLVRRARTILKQKIDENSIGKKIIVIDIGCGSGIIGTSIADLADEVIFLDVSPEALRVAEENFRTHFPEKKAKFIVSDLLSVFLDQSIQLPRHPATTLFLTNLPYIRDEDWQNMSADTVHEPKLALFGGEKTGFELYERLFQEFDKLSNILPSNYPTIQLLYEFGFDQREVAEEVVKQYPQWEYSFFPDYAGIERFGEIYMKNPQ